MNNNYVQGKYFPINEKKYINGDIHDIVYRSSWELEFMKKCDLSQEIVAWNSESLIIPYISKADGKQHRYFIDFVIWIKTESGIKKKYIEIKPEIQTKPPKKTPKEKEHSFNERVRTYLTNISKWEAAREFASKNNADFVIITEKHLYPFLTKQKRYSAKKGKKNG